MSEMRRPAGDPGLRPAGDPGYWRAGQRKKTAAPRLQARKLLYLTMFNGLWYLTPREGLGEKR
jgi:hypothetical protein